MKYKKIDIEISLFFAFVLTLVASSDLAWSFYKVSEAVEVLPFLPVYPLFLIPGLNILVAWTVGSGLMWNLIFLFPMATIIFFLQSKIILSIKKDTNIFIRHILPFIYVFMVLSIFLYLLVLLPNESPVLSYI